MMAAGFVRLLVQPLRQRNALIERPEAACQRPRQIFIEREAHQFGRVSMPDMTTVPNEITVLDFPHDAVAIGASKQRPFADAIHFAHAPRTSCGNVHFVSDFRRDVDRRRDGLFDKLLKQRGHAGQTGNVSWL